MVLGVASRTPVSYHIRQVGVTVLQPGGSEHEGLSAYTFLWEVHTSVLCWSQAPPGLSHECCDCALVDSPVNKLKHYEVELIIVLETQDLTELRL